MDGPLRVMWLLNHTTLRKFEMPQMEKLGIKEIFLPKSYPYDEGNLSASVDYSKDADLNVPATDVRILNQQNWYESPSQEAWEIANRHFDVLFLGFFPNQIRSALINFRGIIVLHAFGLTGNETYSNLLRQHLTTGEFQKLRKISHRFIFGAGYEHLAAIEDDFVRSRNCFLPVGLPVHDRSTKWRGNDKRIFFICPRINTTHYFHHIYDVFIRSFSEFPFVIGGAQPVPVEDKRVLGFVDRSTHETNMRELAVMFYHSQEPNHIHYHPFEAVQSGMPLIFMAGGILDRFGGKDLPGRSGSITEARSKIRRILAGDKALIENVRRSQTVLLEPMKFENCAPHWRKGFDRIRGALHLSRAANSAEPRKRQRVAVIIPVDYRGGTLRAAKMIAEAIDIGSRQAGEAVDVVLAHLDDPVAYRDEDFHDLPNSIQRRSFRWNKLSLDQARRAAFFYGNLARMPTASTYQVPDDSIQQFLDCDFWLFISDRLEHPLLELRPYGLVVFDYLIRYEKLHSEAVYQPFLDSARRAERVFVTTEFTRRDAIAFAGVSKERIIRLPILAPIFDRKNSPSLARPKRPFFLWTTNLAPHKNHENAFRALAHYYDVLGGKLRCVITGVGTEKLKSPDNALYGSAELFRQSSRLKRNLKILGELPDALYQATLAQAEFLWHAGRIDNGTFTVVEAAQLGVPSLSSDYPAMREFDETFSLNLQWADPADPRSMAEGLKRMEMDAKEFGGRLPSTERLADHSLERLAGAYWNAVKKCL
jgi:glycosyltransferase involved in cell wall biosynthesis